MKPGPLRFLKIRTGGARGEKQPLPLCRTDKRKEGENVANIISWLQVYVLSWLKPPKTITVIDVVQILLIAWIVYRLILWMKNTRAYTLLKGILFVAAFVLVANIFNMEVIVWLIGNLSVAAITAIVIIFQPELRKALEQVGHSHFFASLMSLNRSEEENKRFSDKTINELVRASFEMAEVRTGALIVIQEDTSLLDYERTGIPLDAVVTGQLLINVFEKNTPLHDGAVIIRDDRVAAATCYLPLSDNMNLSKNLGTRHRAGVGISEVSDCLTIIVSEETGNVSYAKKGQIHTAITPKELRTQLELAQLRYPIREKTTKTRRARRGRKEK